MLASVLISSLALHGAARQVVISTAMFRLTGPQKWAGCSLRWPLFLPLCFHFALANATAGCCCGKLELIGASAKVSQVVTPWSSEALQARAEYSAPACQRKPEREQRGSGSGSWIYQPVLKSSFVSSPDGKTL